MMAMHMDILIVKNELETMDLTWWLNLALSQTINRLNINLP